MSEMRFHCISTIVVCSFVIFSDIFLFIADDKFDTSQKASEVLARLAQVILKSTLFYRVVDLRDIFELRLTT